ncbi:hypothetical protein HK104_010542 [Borealophlyctis nickersoniae]|nr:hypothetical protein HK104_010542 [Borealophlyctis nickersoniae]
MLVSLKSLVTIVTVSLALSTTAPVTAAAHPPYNPAGKGDSRSPCPLLNTLANHNIYRHSGRDLTYDEIYSGLRKAGVDHAVSNRLASGALKLVGHDDPTGERKLHLADLGKHGVIEHDASLTRSDFGVGDSDKVNETLVNQLLATSSSGTHLTIRDLAHLRRLRYTQSRLTNPSFTFGPWATFLASGESALLIEIMGNDGQLPLDQAKEFLLKEKFPDSWTPHDPPKGRWDLAKRAAELRWAMLTEAESPVEVKAKEALRTKQAAEVKGKVEEVRKEAKGKGEEVKVKVEEVKEKAKVKGEEVKGKVEEVTEKAKAKGDEVKQKVEKETAKKEAEVKQKVKAAEKEVKEKVKAAGEDVKDKVKAVEKEARDEL